MGTISKIEHEALIKCGPLLYKISPERIRDEFLKGIKSAKSIPHFINLLNRYDLFKWIFGSLLVDLSAANEIKDPIVLIANLLRKNAPNDVKRILNNFRYTLEEVAKIVFLLSFLKFKPEMIYQMKKLEFASKISPEEIKEFATLNNLDMHLTEAFIKFQLSAKGEDFMSQGMKAGPELGKAIVNAEIENFKKSININESDNKLHGNEEKVGNIVLHTSNSKVRGDIIKSGLIPKVGDSYELHYSGLGINTKPAIFAINNDDLSDAYDSTWDDDIWAINTKIANVKWFKDINIGIKNAIIAFEPIPPTALKLLHKGTGTDKF